MADFTPYGYNDIARQKASDRFGQYWVEPEAYQRYTGDWGDYQNAYYDFARTNIDLAKSDAYQKFMDRQRRLGTGDSPTSDVLWQTRMEPEYLAKYLQASDASQLARGQMEMSDLSQYNAAMQSRANTKSNALLNYMQQQFQNDLSQWNANTGAGWRNRALSMAANANNQGIGGILGSLFGQLPAAFLNIAQGGKLMGLFGQGNAAMDSWGGNAADDSWGLNAGAGGGGGDLAGGIGGGIGGSAGGGIGDAFGGSFFM